MLTPTSTVSPSPSLVSLCAVVSPVPPPTRDTDTGASEHSCVSETGYREISAFYKRNYNKSVAPTRPPPLPAQAGSLQRAPWRGGSAQCQDPLPSSPQPRAAGAIFTGLCGDVR